jgi:hypothetical protein
MWMVVYFSCIATIVWFDIFGIQTDPNLPSQYLPPRVDELIDELSAKMKILWNEVSLSVDSEKMIVDDQSMDIENGEISNNGHDKPRREV